MKYEVRPDAHGSSCIVVERAGSTTHHLLTEPGYAVERVVAFFTPAAIPRLAIGSVVANLYSLVVTGSPLALLDVVFGSLGTLLGAAWMWRFRNRTGLGLLGPVVSNALIVPAYLPLLVKGLGLYRIPLLGIDFEGKWLPMYLFGVVTVGIGQAVVVYGLGLPLLIALRRLGLEGFLHGRE